MRLCRHWSAETTTSGLTQAMAPRLSKEVGEATWRPQQAPPDNLLLQITSQIENMRVRATDLVANAGLRALG